MSKPRDIRVLKGGLTFGSRVYKAGELLEPRHHSERVHAYASGEKKFFTGERVVEFVEEAPEAESPSVLTEVTIGNGPVSSTDSEESEEVEADVLEIEGGTVDEQGEVTAEAPPEPQAEPQPEVETDESDLVDFILTMVEEGHTKTEVVETLAEGDEYSQKQVRGEFDRLMEVGRILETEERGKYRVTE